MLTLTNFFAVSIILLILPTSISVDNSYETCSTLFSCGNNISNVGYPFWGAGRPKYCGHPSLQLQCLASNRGDQVQLIIDQEINATYDVLNMKLNPLDITLELREYENIICKTIRKEYSELFNFTSNDVSINFVYNCPTDISVSNLHDPIPCLGFPTDYEAYYVHNMSATKEYASCSSFEFPVLKDQLDLYNQGQMNSFKEVLKQGFEVRYEYSSECIKCNNSGGMCGSYDLDFACFYNNGTDENVKPNQKSGTPTMFLFDYSRSFR
ncbi:LEAF RUST 10 DISEASE-RESISTANCE LOCUS RECEPTOR-LIKE PROTEIN KINASE-like 1.3 [Silene latifolia]|uniref:LEAF RUST 10 DISEASE-RESISTANCE LOCUS RECEPTOR-LIKE PROTEIN KINASE-like 1.3 n=1 Tax=Silene latifolia TaxID=37657 RepID=UPI003D7703C9